MHIDRYLNRIGVRGADDASLAALIELHRRHLWAVPFENLDIALGRPIDLTLQSLYDKVVGHRRGGFCYELNGLFAWALEQLGFRVSHLAGRVFHDSRPGPPFDHLLLLVELDEPWVADVGFGDSFVDPLRLDARGVVCAQINGGYRLESSGEEWILWRSAPDGTWGPQYSFTLAPRELDEFAGMCRHHQTSPESPFTQKTVCSLATPSGRRTLTNGRLITTDGARREERDITSGFEYMDLLRTAFGIVLPDGTDARELMKRTRGQA